MAETVLTTWDFRGSSALVTGGARRIGKAIAYRLASAGCNIVLHYNRSAGEADAAIKSIRKKGVKAWKVQADLSDPSEAEKLLGQAMGKAGRIEILINNAAIFPRSTIATLSIEDLNHVLMVNAIAPMVLTRAFAEKTERGAVVNLLDAVMGTMRTNHAGYQLSKQMLATITHMTAAEFAPSVRVNGIAPGFVLPAEDGEASTLDELAGRTPLKRPPSLREVTDTVVFLIANTSLTGEIVYVDGGNHLRWR